MNKIGVAGDSSVRRRMTNDTGFFPIFLTLPSIRTYRRYRPF